MRSPAAAIAWEFRRQHRWGLAAFVLYLVALAVLRLWFLRSGQHLTFEAEWQFVLAVIVPANSILMYFIAVFSFGLTGDLAARESIYPAGMFTRPVTSAALAGWPMLYGTVLMAILWLTTRLLAIWPTEAHVPLFWPALFAAVVLAWTQALNWMAYPLRGLRVIVTVLWLTTIAFVVLLALHFKAPEGVMLALRAPHLPLAYLVARAAVGRARRGEVPDWRIRDLLAWRPDQRRDGKHWPSPAMGLVYGSTTRADDLLSWDSR